VSKNHFLTISRPFPAICRTAKSGENAGFAAPLPFSAGRARLKNSENGGNGKGSGRSNPCHFSRGHLI
jgi:hypothetical protein